MENVEERRHVSGLIKKVLLSEIVVRDAINAFPFGSEDESIKAAYHALVHYEADEDLRQKDDLYKEEQDDYLLMICNTLEKGEDLPINIINSYKEYYKTANIKNEDNFMGKVKSFFKMLNV
ncbi:hypothetical protein J6S88_04845 [bacterium]|nr:hypothetical protein [bacterium]